MDCDWFPFINFSKIDLVRKKTSNKMPCPLAEAMESQRIWINKAQYVDAERKYYTKVNHQKKCVFFLLFWNVHVPVLKYFIFSRRSMNRIAYSNQHLGVGSFNVLLLFPLNRQIKYLKFSSLDSFVLSKFHFNF